MEGVSIHGRSFSASNRNGRGLLTLLSSPPTCSSMMCATCSSVILSQDKDGNGSISLDEFTQAVASMGVQADKTLLNEMFSSADTDLGGEIDYVEFTRLVQSWRG